MLVYKTIAIGCVAGKLSIASQGLFVATHRTITPALMSTQIGWYWHTSDDRQNLIFLDVPAVINRGFLLKSLVMVTN
ncbi:hypothetical protein [Microcoleus sp. CAWBG58]|uniref:hypothetical protein n=1 Tax=Microcoleus sp. CAWBG58 TaxID=2841651 RepID=UPI0025EA716D|nr:hypothetical protein [Microcoleus sp. CAWBG58]